MEIELGNGVSVTLDDAQWSRQFNDLKGLGAETVQLFWSHCGMSGELVLPIPEVMSQREQDIYAPPIKIDLDMLRGKQITDLQKRVAALEAERGQNGLNIPTPQPGRAFIHGLEVPVELPFVTFDSQEQVNEASDNLAASTESKGAFEHPCPLCGLRSEHTFCLPLSKVFPKGSFVADLRERSKRQHQELVESEQKRLQGENAELKRQLHNSAMAGKSHADVYLEENRQLKGIVANKTQLISGLIENATQLQAEIATLRHTVEALSLK